MSEAIDGANAWRTETPGCEGWRRTARPDSLAKYFMVSADGHVQEPSDLWATRMAAAYRERIPGVVLDGKGNKYQKTEGFRPLRLQNTKFEGEDLLRNQSGKTPEDRIRDLALDGVDAEILFPNKGLTIWATADAEFSHAMCRAYNEWAWEEFGAHNDRLAPMACIAPGALEASIEEIQRCAALGFKGLSLPCKPVWGAPDHTQLN
jgi:predicted TIM-barrel fold metal-dependent hydrolase